MISGSCVNLMFFCPLTPTPIEFLACSHMCVQYSLVSTVQWHFGTRKCTAARFVLNWLFACISELYLSRARAQGWWQQRPDEWVGNGTDIRSF